MRAINLLFTAPLDFDPLVANKYRALAGLDPFEADVVGTRAVEVWVCNPKQHFMVDKLVLNLFPKLKILATPSTGTNHIDMEECKKRGIKVLSLLDDRPRLNEISASSEFTFKLILDALRMNPPRELRDKTVGIVGYGRIGRNIADWCLMFGAWDVFIYDPYVRDSASVSLDAIFSQCDIVVICCALTDETRGMVGKELISCMKRGAALVNTARGEVINEHELVDVMRKRRDLRVVLDVICGEVDGTANPERLKSLGAIVTPHIAGETYDSRTKAAEIIYDLIVREYER